MERYRGESCGEVERDRAEADFSFAFPFASVFLCPLGSICLLSVEFLSYI